MSDRALTLARTESFQVPALVADVGPEATKRFFEFFTVPIRNKNTRIAYYHAIGHFAMPLMIWPLFSHILPSRDSAMPMLQYSPWPALARKTQELRSPFLIEGVPFVVNSNDLADANTTIVKLAQRSWRQNAVTRIQMSQISSFDQVGVVPNLGQ